MSDNEIEDGMSDTRMAAPTPTAKKWPRRKDDSTA